MTDRDGRPPSRPRTGRRPGASDTGPAILEAARARFAADGYAGATIRKIAADAGVDPALVVRMHRSKEGLFAAVMSVPPTVLARIDASFDGPAEALGERFARAFLGVWEDDPAEAEPLLATFRSAMSSDQAAVQLRSFVQARLVDGLAPHLGTGTDVASRAGLASSMLLGIVVGRHIVRFESLASEDRDALVRAVAPAIQAILVPDPRARRDQPPPPYLNNC